MKGKYEEPIILLISIEQADIVNAVLCHKHTLDSHAECKARINLGVDPAV